MTDAQKRFCDEYLIDLNATRAYKVAYPKIKKDHTATVNGNRLLTFADIKKYISDKIKEREKRTEVTQDRVIQELAKIAFVDIRELYNDSGGLKNIKDIDENTAGAINSLETLEEYAGYGDDREKIGDTKKVKLIDKTKALELLGKHLGMFKEKVEFNGKLKDRCEGFFQYRIRSLCCDIKRREKR